jgi:NADH-quinone oxidoreductase subunit F
LDIHLTGDQPTAEEKDAVDRELGAPQTGWEGGERRIAEDGRAAFGGHEARSRRHLLLPVLHAVQARAGWVSPGAVNYIALRLDTAPAEVYGVASFYGMFAMERRPPVVAHVCDDIACMARGAGELCGQVEKQLAGAEGFKIQRGPCLGLCERAPAALVTAAGETPRERVLAPATPEALVNLIQSAVRCEMPAEPDVLRVAASLPQAGQPGLRLLRRIGQIDPADIDDYRRLGGYEALRAAVNMGPEGVLRELLASRLLGRGGAAFPTGKKAEALHVQIPHGRTHYLICNADESEPGTFKDRIVMEGDPFAVIEGMTIVALAAGARQGYIYIRGEYPLATERLRQAIRSARAHGMLGSAIFGRQFQFDIELRRGAGAYICGEETALFNSIEGYRGEPRNKPPFPTQAGLFQKPTQVNNVETLINVPEIIRMGGAAYASIGTAQSAGPRLFCLSGHIARPGVYEVPFGATLHEVIELAGGVSGNGRLQAVLLGGAAGAFVSPKELDTPLTFEGTRAIGATLGSGVIMPFDDSVDLKAILMRIASFFRDESCGQCVPCRIGTIRQEETLERLIHSRPLGNTAAEVQLLREMGQAMRDASICGLGQTASSALESALNRWSLFA